MSARRLVCGSLVVVCAMFGVPVLGCASAFAVEWVSGTPSSFGSGGSGAGQFGSEAPGAVAVEASTGDVFVLDAANGRVERFSPQGVFEAQITGVETPAGSFSSARDGVAVDSRGDVFVADTGHRAVDVFRPKGVSGAARDEYEYVPVGAGGSLALSYEPTGVAVDGEGDVYVGGGRFSAVVHRYSSLGGEVEYGGVDGGGFVTPHDLAVSAAGTALYVAVESFSGSVIVKLALSANGVRESEAPFESTEALGVALAPDGDVFAFNLADTSVGEYEPDGTLVGEEFGSGMIGFSEGLAFSAFDEHLYVADSGRNAVDVFEQARPEAPVPTTGAVSGVDETGVTLDGTVKPDLLETEYYFEYGETESYGASVPVPPAKIPAQSGVIAVAEQVTGLASGRIYHYRLVASNALGGPVYGSDEVFATPEAPLSEAGEAQGTALVFDGELNSHGAAGKLTYWFEYNAGASCSGGQSTPVVEVSEGRQLHVEVEVPGLAPSTQYTYCLISRNAYGGQAQGGEVSLSTGALPAPRISGEAFSSVGYSSATVSAQVNPGGLGSEYYFEYGTSRAYGMVTPTKNAGDSEEAVGVSAQLSGLSPGVEYHFRVVARSANGETSRGRDTVFATYPAGAATLPNGRVYELVTPVSNGNVNVYRPHATGSYVLSPEDDLRVEHPFRAAADGDAVAYVGDPPPVGGSSSQGPGKGNQYLAVRAAGGGWAQQNVQPPDEEYKYQLAYTSFSSELSAGFLSSPRPLVGGVPSGGVLYSRDDANGEYGMVAAGGAYEGSTADASHVLVADAGNLYDFTEGALKQVNVLPSGAVAPDSKFGGLDLLDAISSEGSRIFWTDSKGNLYVRENDATTVEIAEGAAFWTASYDGARAFFTKGGLYEYDAATAQTTDLTPSVNVQWVIGASETGEYVYYVVGAKNNSGNLYQWHDGTTTFIANLSSKDLYDLPGSGEGPGGNYGDIGSFTSSVFKSLGLAHRTAEVAADGSLVFMAKERLTGYVAEGEIRPGEFGPLTEVFDFDAGAGRLYCVSCNPSGEPPSIVGDEGAGEQAAYLPVSNSETYQPRWISADGTRVFFDSVEPLVPQDVNGVQDVYEWERPVEGPGEKGCRQREGCIYLLSGGTSNTFSWFLDASASGDDVFIITRAQLVGEDKNDNYNVYDVSSDGPERPAPSACAGTGCQGVPSAPPIFATPASVTFEGVGNFSPPAPSVSGPGPKSKSKPVKCRKRKKGRCVKAKSKRRTKGKRAGAERRGGS